MVSASSIWSGGRRERSFTMKILDVRTRPPFGSIRDGMFNNPGRELFEPEAFAPRFGMSVGESARQRSMSLFIQEMDAAGITLGAVLIRKSTGMDNNDLARLDAAYPGRFIGIAGIDPLDGEEALRETEHFALKGACRGILLEPGFCSTPALRQTSGFTRSTNCASNTATPYSCPSGGMLLQI